tara:strand:- start:231 stop:2738 length:2508 start_codon:yes stop_codon:yes gene_type:complete
VQAQCGIETVPGFSYLGPAGDVDAVCYWDPDGSGPQQPRLFVGGSMDLVERTACAGAATYEFSTRSWSALPVGTFDRVTAATVDAAGVLFVAGTLGSGASIQRRVASFDGTSWTVLGGEFDGPISTLAVFGNELIAGGGFSQNGSQPLLRIARWNGTAWGAMGGGVTGGSASVAALCTMTTGELAVGGTFTAAGGMPAANIARWNGTTWQAFGSGLPPEVTSIATFSTGELFATGLNQTSPAQWDGATWSDLAGLSAGGYQTSWVTALAAGTGYNGEALYFAGNFQVGSTVSGFGTWDQWWGFQAISGLEGVQSLAPTRMVLTALPTAFPSAVSSVVAAGPFTAMSGVACGGLAAVYDGYQVDALSDGIDEAVVVSATLANGDLLIGGRFQQVDGGYLPALAAGDRDGDDWFLPTFGAFPTIQGSFDSPEVRAIVPAAGGGHWLAGSFVFGSVASGSYGADIARLDGTNLTGFGPSPFGAGANAVLEHSNGTVYCGGNGVYRRDGAAWTLLSSVANGLGANCRTLAELPNGDLVVGGDLQLIPGSARPGVMRWDGSSWQQLGAGLTSVAPAGNLVVSASRMRADGVLFVVATAGSTSFVARFDGAAWQLLPGPVSGDLFTLEVLPDGDIVVGGEFDSIAGVAAASIARFDGTSWQAIGDGVRQIDGLPGTVFGLHFSIDGELHICGQFSRHDGEVSENFTRVRSLCPALTQSFAAGCVGSGGQNVLSRASGAWLGSTMRNVASGMPSNGLVVEVLGLAPALAPLPLSSCTLWVRPDVLTLYVPVAGRVGMQSAIPTSPTLIGQMLYQQAVGVEFAGSAITGFTSSNRLQHTIGVF